jgi:L-lactate dehydrogenase (cytochrome)/glycolate oxidase
VLIGRAYLWGLAANGQAGVENVLDILRGGLDSAVLGLGHSSVHTLGPSDVVAPHDFTRANQLPGSGDPTILAKERIGVRDTEPGADSIDNPAQLTLRPC